MGIADEAVVFVRSQLEGRANPAKAGPMAAYMKTDMPFFGVQKAGRTPIVRALVDRFAPTDRTQYEMVVRALWKQSHREEKYVAIDYAESFPDFIDTRSVPLYRDIIVDGAWWDFVDRVAAHLVGGALQVDRPDVTATLRAWIDDPIMWLRRTAIIAQLTHKDTTDTGLLADACLANLDDTEFFIRKAIGWALRQYAKTDPDWVRVFVAEHGDAMSGLTRREAMKHLEE